jgi:hypothetical protein
MFDEKQQLSVKWDFLAAASSASGTWWVVIGVS